MRVVSRNWGVGALGMFFLSVLSFSGCARAADPEPNLPGQKPAESPPKQDSPSAEELEALGLKVFGPHEHTGKYVGPHYRIASVSEQVGKRTVTEEELERSRKGSAVVGVEIQELEVTTKYGKFRDKFIVVKRLVDLWAEQDEQAWKKAVAEKHLILADIGGYKWRQFFAGKGWAPYMHFSQDGEQRLTTASYQAPEGGVFYVEMFVCEKPTSGFDHDLLRWVLIQGGGKMRSIGKHYVFEYNERGSEDGAIWKASDTIFISIANAGRYPRQVIEAYLEKYPCVLTKDYQIDYAKWAAEEMAFRLERLGKALAAGPDSLQKTGISFYNEWAALRVYFLFPFDKKKCTDPEECREVKKLVEEWWAANKDKLSWNPKTRKFEAKE